MSHPLNALYVAHRDAPTDDTLNQLLHAVTDYAITLCRRSGSPHADDLAQEITLKTWRALPRFKAQSGFRSFVHNVATCHLIDAARAAKRRPEPEPLDQGYEGESPDKPLRDPAKLPGLNSDEREVLSTFTNTRDFDATARLLNLTPRAVRSRIERIRNKLALERAESAPFSA